MVDRIDEFNANNPNNPTSKTVTLDRDTWHNLKMRLDEAADIGEELTEVAQHFETRMFGHLSKLEADNMEGQPVYKELSTYCRNVLFLGKYLQELTFNMLQVEPEEPDTEAVEDEPEVAEAGELYQVIKSMSDADQVTLAKFESMLDMEGVTMLRKNIRTLLKQFPGKGLKEILDNLQGRFDSDE